jgi:hypothetical protein
MPWSVMRHWQRAAMGDARSSITLRVQDAWKWWRPCFGSEPIPEYKTAADTNHSTP